ncbi:alpha/beta hydrolase [Methylibium sp. Root1272]|uniref:alpha/beta hydrolase n=1 Tax=Methylibium sp. Root1272 TaxID=1736441 RepID=UPI0006FBD7CC|nr:alpha/beta hydrolase [Methylibium sp. Root1272]KQW69885.1 lipase [Methylibium sp. Root1272]
MPLDPQVQGLLDAFKAQGLKGFEQMSVPEARETAMAFVGLEGEAEQVAQVTAHQVPVDGGSLPARVYHPAGAGPHPVLVYYHGGGFVLGNLELIDKVARSLVNASGAAVVTVEYRKAPEHRWPTAPEDAYATLLWVRQQAASIGLDGTRLAVGGDSAGGNLAAVVSQMARDRDGPKLTHQLLVYPVTDAGGSYPSRSENAEGYLLTKKAMDWFFDHYLADPAQAEQPYCSPIRGELAGLPPATLITAGYDPLRDEGEAYGAALAGAGVAVTSLRNPTMIHGFFWMKGVIGHTAGVYAQVGAQLRRAFGTA